MPDYANSSIYTIRFYDNDKLIFIGSTIQSLSVRFGGHKKIYRLHFVNMLWKITTEILNVVILNF
jgi:hypothetical protein